MECKIGYNMYKIGQAVKKMTDNFTRIPFERLLNVTRLITIFYMEISKDFSNGGETHGFWEMVYIDKGEMICTADKKSFRLKSGEMTFHKPYEFHNLSGDGKTPPNVSILTFECNSRAMEYFEGKIFKLSAEEKRLLAMLFEEGVASYRLQSVNNPLLQNMERVENAPVGGSQMIKNLLEAFLIMLMRHTDVITKQKRTELTVDGISIPDQLREILDYIQESLYGRITVADVARRVNKSESAVKQLFSAYMKEGIMSYYMRKKIGEAKRLMRKGGYNMAQIADMLGFDTPQYFSKCFKRLTNMTPSEYKQSIMP